MLSASIPEHFRLIYPADQISSAVSRLAQQIEPWAREVFEASGEDIVTIPVLRGGIFFFADLVRALKTSVHITPVRTWAYEVEENAVMKPKVELHIDDVSAKGRSILLIDDICDSGRTLCALHDAFQEHGAAEVRSAVLIKRVMDEETFNPNYVGFDYTGPEWFVGYGMEDKERWRNLDSIYIIEK